MRLPLRLWRKRATRSCSPPVSNGPTVSFLSAVAQNGCALECCLTGAAARPCSDSAALQRAAGRLRGAATRP